MDNQIEWSKTVAGIWRHRKQYLRAVKQVDDITLQKLIGIDRQKQALMENTQRFLQSKPANNALLWGSRGTGKSSLVKAILNEYAAKGLRLLQIDKDDLLDLPEILDGVRDLNYRFIVYCDDISFEASESSYKALKSVLDGSIELPPSNVLLYATSNRRHLLPEYMRDNLSAELVDNEIHHSDAVEEKISLSERFGLWLGFYAFNMDDYLSIVQHYFAGYQGDQARLLEAARDFALLRGNHSGRTAQQFYNYFSEQ